MPFVEAAAAPGEGYARRVLSRRKDYTSRAFKSRTGFASYHHCRRHRHRVRLLQLPDKKTNIIILYYIYIYIPWREVDDDDISRPQGRFIYIITQRALYTKYTYNMYVCLCVCVCVYLHTLTIASTTITRSYWRAVCVILSYSSISYGCGRGGKRETCIYTRQRGRYRRTRAFVEPGLSTRDRCAKTHKAVRLGFHSIFLYLTSRYVPSYNDNKRATWASWTEFFFIHVYSLSFPTRDTQNNITPRITGPIYV